MSEVFDFAETRRQAQEAFNSNLIQSITDYTFDNFEHDLMCDLCLAIEDNEPRIDIEDMPYDDTAAIFLYGWIIQNGLLSMRDGECDPTSTDNNQALCKWAAAIVKKGAH